MKSPNQLRLQSRRYMILAASVFMMTPAFASAQPGFGRVANQPWGGDVMVMNRMSSKSASGILDGRIVPTGSVGAASGGRSAVGSVGAVSSGASAAAAVPRTASLNLMPFIALAWQQARTRMIDTALVFLHERDVGGGFRTSRNTITLAESGPLLVGFDGRGFTIRYVLTGNRLSTYFRTPTPLGRDFDPGFVVDFDMDVYIDVELRGNQLVAGPARIQPTVKPPTGKNITGDFAVAVADLLSLLSGADFVGLLVREINGRKFEMQAGLNQHLATFNPVLRSAAQGGVIVPGFDGRSLTLTIRDARAAPVVR